MKKILVLTVAFLLVFSVASKAQERRIGGMVSGIFFADFSQNNSSPARLGISAPQFALVLEDEARNFHEFSLTNFYVQKELKPQFATAGINSNFGLGVGYNYKFNFLKEKETNLRPYLLISTGLSFQYLHFEPVVSTSFPFSFMNLNVPISVGPGMRWQKSERLFFDFSIPVQIITMNYRLDKNNDPSTGSSTTVAFDSDIKVSSVQLNVGAGLWLGTRKPK